MAAKTYLIPGFGFINIPDGGTREYLIPGLGFINESIASGVSSTTYTITATGIGAMNGFAYSIDQNNVRATTTVPTANGWQGAPKNCWILKPDGSC